jgi:hypothetical protein
MCFAHKVVQFKDLDDAKGVICDSHTSDIILFSDLKTTFKDRTKENNPCSVTSMGQVG